MKKIDFVFVYEVKPREFESISLLGYELRRRGYTVAYVNTWHEFYWLVKGRISAKIVLTSAAYNTEVLDFMLGFVKSADKVVNMQWEQLLGMGQKDDKTTDYYIQGKAEEIVHLSWGKANYDRLVEECHLNKRNVKLTGHIGMDFLRPELRSYYLSRQEICKKYGLPEDKKLCLFISSFSYVNLPHERTAYVGEDFVDLSVDSQKIILQWMERALKEREDIVFIYRPHPAEANNTELLEMENRLDRFKVIKDFSVKQWILVADQIYNWYSTSLMEIFCAGKSCFLLRPLEMPMNYEIEIFKDAQFMNQYEEFAASIDKTDKFPVPDEIMYENYYLDEAEPAYIKAANVLESVYKDEEYSLPIDFKEKETYTFRQMLKAFPPVKAMLPLLWKIEASFGNHVAAENLKYKKYAKQMDAQNYASDEEFQSQMNKIGKCLQSNNENEDNCESIKEN